MTLCNPSRATLADVLVAIQASGLSTPRRNDMTSAVRTIGKALGHSLDRIEVNPRQLAIRLNTISPLAIGMTQTRWNNVRSLLRAAIRLIVKVLPGSDRTELSADWATLLAIIAPQRRERIRVSRVVHWFSRQGILPKFVTRADLERFEKELRSEALLSNPEATWANTVRAWNRAIQAIPSWPQVTIERLSRKEVYVMPWNFFPASLKQDVDGWLRRLGCADLLDDDGPTRPVSSSTLTMREYQLRAFASALALRGRDPAGLTSLAACLTLENYMEGLAFFHERRGNKSSSAIHGVAAMLKGVARHYLKATPETLAAMARFMKKLAVEQGGLSRKNRDRLRPLEDPDKALALLRMPLTIQDGLMRGKYPLHQRTLLAQTAVAIELLLFAPIRIGNLVSINIDRHLISVGKKLHLVFSADEVKNNADLEFELPDESAALISWYVSQYRKAPADNQALFPGRAGGAKTIGTLRKQINEGVERFTGLKVNPHLFRHIGAKLYLDQNPGGYEVMRRVLAHKSMDTTTNFYTGLETKGAIRNFSNTIMKMRQSVNVGKSS